MQKSVHLFGPAELFSKLKLQGVEYGEGMVKAAHSLNKQHFEPKTSFDVAAMLDLGASVLDNSCYDFVKTDRILINVNSLDLQKKSQNRDDHESKFRKDVL